MTQTWGPGDGFSTSVGIFQQINMSTRLLADTCIDVDESADEVITTVSCIKMLYGYLHGQVVCSLFIS